jgi:hypothetical protein
MREPEQMQEPEENEAGTFRIETDSVSIEADPVEVFRFVADLNNWKKLSDFWQDLEQVNDDEWVAHTPQGDVVIYPQFNADNLLLDHICRVPSGDVQFILYRVVKNGSGSELIISNPQTAGVSDEEYAEQLAGMKQELGNIKAILETGDNLTLSIVDGVEKPIISELGELPEPQNPPESPFTGGYE